MTPSTQYQQNRTALDELMDFISTDEFIELPAVERQKYMQKLEELIRLITITVKV